MHVKLFLYIKHNFGASALQYFNPKHACVPTDEDTFTVIRCRVGSAFENDIHEMQNLC